MAAGFAVPASAQVAVEAALQTDHRIRGYSVSDEEPSASVSFSYDDPSGAYVAELRRTAITLAHKRGKPEREVFAEAVAVVARHFGVARKPMGFAARR